MKKNIMLLIGQLTNGGAEHSIINLANELSKKHNVILVTANAKKTDYECKCKIIEVDELRSNRRRLIGLFKIYKLKKKYNISTSISYTTFYNFVNVITKRKEKVIISIRNHLSAKKESKKFDLMHKYSIRGADLIVCCSKSLKDDQVINYKASIKKVVVINNFCDELYISSTEKRNDLGTDNIIISMARLVRHKGHEHVIKAMSLVTKKVRNAKLLIFGRGEEELNLKTLIKKYNLEDNVILMGFSLNPYEYLKCAKCFVLASDYEGFPNVLLEAMMCKVPLIATDSPGGAKEMLSDNYKYNDYTDVLLEEKYGILVPSFSLEHDVNDITKREEILASAILKVIKNKDIYSNYSNMSYERSKKYSMSKILKQWTDIIE